MFAITFFKTSLISAVCETHLLLVILWGSIERLQLERVVSIFYSHLNSIVCCFFARQARGNEVTRSWRQPYFYFV